MRVLIPLIALPLLVASPAPAATWQIMPAVSRLHFHGMQTGVPFAGSFQKWTAAISFDPTHPEAAHAKVTVDLASAKTGDVQRDTALPQPDWFDAKAFPQAVFEVAGFVAKGDGNYEAPGTLTIRGIAKPVTVSFFLTLADNRAIVKGEAELIRTDFGVGQGVWSSADSVALKVGVDFDLIAVDTGS